MYLNNCRKFIKKHSDKILLGVCCAALCGAIFSLLAKEASSGDTLAAVILTDR